MKVMRKYLYLLIAPLFMISCEEYLQQEPVDQITSDVLIVDQESANAAVLGVYSRLQVATAFGNDAITLPGVASDELVHSGSFPTIAEVDLNDVNAANITIDNMWQTMYTGIFQANTILTALESATEYTALTPELRTQYIGEARFLRAYFHWYLASMYGNVPLVTSAALPDNTEIGQTAKAEVYQFVITEAAAAATELVGAGVDDGAASQYRAGEYAAKALQARALLYAGQASEAAAVADDVITNGGFALETNYPDLFEPSTSSEEIIFGLFYSTLDQSGLAFQFLPAGRFEFAVSPKLVSAVDPADTRALWEVNPADGDGRSNVTKYSDIATGTDNTILFRLAEMYLIRAEGNPATALSDINLLRDRANATPVSAVDLQTILDERFIELSFEGHRWFDLVRTGTAGAVMSAINPTTWDATDVLMPIPNRDILQNPNLTQNEGY
jgi:hypothetical protein